MRHGSDGEARAAADNPGRRELRLVGRCLDLVHSRCKGKTMTLMQALKVWWGYSWRAGILVIPLWTISTVWSVMGMVSAVKDIQFPGCNLENLDVGQLAGQLSRAFSGGLSLSILFMVLTTAVQVFAMRWTLNSRWSDFQLKAVPPDASVGAGSRPVQ